MKRRDKFFLGAIGAATPLIAKLYAGHITMPETFSFTLWLGIFLRYGMMFVLGGFLAQFVEEKQPLKIFYFGLGLPAFILAATGGGPVEKGPLHPGPDLLKPPTNISSLSHPGGKGFFIGLAYAQSEENIPVKELPIGSEEKPWQQFLRGLTGKSVQQPIPEKVHRGPWFVIVGSHLKSEDAKEQVKQLKAQDLSKEFNPEIYTYPGSRYFAVTVGSYLPESEAKELKEKAISAGLKQTYLWKLP